jgi:hypothetical protein
MGARAVLARKQSVRGTTAGGNVQIAQDPDEWLDCGNWADAFITVRVDYAAPYGSESIGIWLMTLDEKRSSFAAGPPDGPLTVVKAFGTVATGKWYKHLATLENASIGALSNPVERWLFWAVASDIGATGGDFQVDFSIDVTLKRPA